MKIIGNIKIVLADDDADDREFFRQAVVDSGISAELIAVVDGRQLLDLLLVGENALLPDVIFLDLNMPGLDGRSCLGEIRRQEKLMGTPVIILSTSSWWKDIDEMYIGGANMYISKVVFYPNGVEWIRKLFPPDWRETLMNPTRERFAFTD